MLHKFHKISALIIGAFVLVHLINHLFILSGTFLNHVGAVLFGRFIAGLDTNIYFGIAGFYKAPFHFYFIPYYFLAVVAIFVHIASAFYWLSRNAVNDPMRTKLTYSIIIVGILLSVTLMLGFNGVFNEIIIPVEYFELYE